MKELSIEQKAKAYDEAIEKLRRFYRDYDTVSCLIDVKEELANLFPELIESNGENIRKALIEMVHDTTGDELWVDYNIHKEEALAWLEKQGEAFTKKDVDDTYLKGVCDAKQELEKQSNASKIEESMRDVEQKAKAFTEANKGLTSDEILAQMRGEGWSENESEDEKMVRALMSICDEWATRHSCLPKENNDIEKIKSWLKSLKDRYTWKPSEEIMKGLNEIINKLAISPVIHEHGYLYDLMVNLRKKLKG